MTVPNIDDTDGFTLGCRPEIWTGSATGRSFTIGQDIPVAFIGRAGRRGHGRWTADQPVSGAATLDLVERHGAGSVLFLTGDNNAVANIIIEAGDGQSGISANERCHGQRSRSARIADRWC